MSNPEFGPLTMSHRANLILKAIRTHPNSFDMTDWVQFLDDDHPQGSLKPTDPVTCKTTLCVAGWAAHLDGWKIDGSAIAYKGSAEERSVARVGEEYLHLTPTQATQLFTTNDDTAIRVLEFMVEHNRYPTDDEYWRDLE